MHVYTHTYLFSMSGLAARVLGLAAPAARERGPQGGLRAAYNNID